MSIARKNFRQEIERLSTEIETAERVKKLNSKLHEYNWVFFHPYNQGYEIDFFEKLIEPPNQENTEQRIFEKFARKFLDLKLTITFIDGFYRKRPFLQEFITQIEESVILCLQKDFSGAINLLLPVIEGSIRNYLVTKKGNTAKSLTNISELSKAFNYMTQDFVKLQAEYLDERFSIPNQTGNYFDSNQEKQILKKHKDYFTLWISQLDDYLKNNFYLDTRENEELKDEFNRHVVAHALGNIDYSFRNYLRLINCLNFLSWAFGVITKDCSILAEVEEEDLRKKLSLYLKILTISETMTETKSQIYNREIESFKKYLDKPLPRFLSISEIIHKQLLKVNNQFG